MIQWSTMFGGKDSFLSCLAHRIAFDTFFSSAFSFATIVLHSIVLNQADGDELILPKSFDKYVESQYLKTCHFDFLNNQPKDIMNRNRNF